ncbi:DUF1992 domain-containing protein [Leisingera aquaemixtae]|uniref:DUF1992 domain-containing protein n=1 Tax=Leisingera aquaemixtae TaxID=1396826 RepID=A0ABY5WM60_9RHOB|nr:DUF1992 domain-containing protein [Leisingera aquaemixtae]UWQ25897.1 DUF1992 domain-containing protein [Leisingera aquaemixtae]UWQ38399.1 DUF1992 domain-containing protein [Leisingera aquaemixtae]UWQ42517.1 DUF1992 domain-containing protein [Leisingera aquaemixtae]
MIRAFRNLIERQLAKAQAEGQLQGLEGEGKPLPDRSGEAHLDAGLAAGLRIMAEAGVVPEEFRLQAELDAARKDYAALTDPQARRAAMARISDLEMRCNMARDARKSFFR